MQELRSLCLRAHCGTRSHVVGHGRHESKFSVKESPVLKTAVSLLHHNAAEWAMIVIQGAKKASYEAISYHLTRCVLGAITSRFEQNLGMSNRCVQGNKFRELRNPAYDLKVAPRIAKTSLLHSWIIILGA